MTEHRLDTPAVLATPFVVLDRTLAIAPAGDHRSRARLPQGGGQPIGITGAIGDQLRHATGRADKRISPSDSNVFPGVSTRRRS